MTYNSSSAIEVMSWTYANKLLNKRVKHETYGRRRRKMICQMSNINVKIIIVTVEITCCIVKTCIHITNTIESLNVQY